jgi:hypothetical protein
MSTIIRHRRVSYRELGPYRRHELLTGEISYAASGYSGYGDGKSHNLSDFIGEEMRTDWLDNRAELLRFWASGECTTPRFFPDSKPWLFACGTARSPPWAERVLNLG